MTTQTYALGRQLGIEAAAREFERQCANPGRDSLPVARMIHRLRQIGAVAVWHGAGTLLTKPRSRAAHVALESECDYWVMLDDDLECDQSTVQRLITATGPASSPRILALPYLMRGAGDEQRIVNVQWVSALVQPSRGVLVRPVKRAGTGCLVVTRKALVDLNEYWRARSLTWRDEDGIEKLALFEQLRTAGGEWLGEDFSFCDRARECGIEIHGLVQGLSVHDGQHLQLDTLLQ